MKGAVIRSAWQQIKAWPQDLRVLSSFLLGIVICVYNVSELCDFSIFLGSGVQILESYIFIGSSPRLFMGVLLGNLILVSDSPFITSLTAYETAKIGREKWLWSRIVYLFFTCFIYLLILILATAVFAALSCGIEFGNEWSDSFRMLAEKNPDFAARSFGISFPYPEFTARTTPYSAIILTLFFNWVYIVLIALSIFCVNLLSDQNLGWIVGSGIHIAGYIVNANLGFFYDIRLSPLCWAMPVNYFIETNRMSSLFYAALFAFLIIVLLDICRRAVKRYEI